MTAALYAKRAGKSVLILEKESFGGQIASSPLVENYPTQKAITGLELSNKIFEQICEIGVDFDCDEVIDLKKDEITNSFIITTPYTTHQAKSVVIATGVKPRRINVPKEEEYIGHGISYCAVCDGAFYKDKEVCVIGDANTAMQYALMLADTSKKVTMCLLFDHFFGSKDLQDKVLNNNKIDIYYEVSLKELIGDKEITSLRFENTKTKEELIIPSSCCFVAIGQEPHNDAFKALVDLDEQGYITSNETETKTEGLFVAGDCRNKKIKQLTTAISDGTIAALNAVNYLNKK